MATSAPTSPDHPPDHRLAGQAGVIMALTSAVCLASIMVARAISEGPGWAMSALKSWWQVAVTVAVGGLVVGYLSGLFHQWWAVQHAARKRIATSEPEANSWLMKLAFLRFWVLLPLNFAPASFGVAFASMSSSERTRDGGSVIPVWFQIGPMILAWPRDEDFLGEPPTVERLERRMWRWVWWLPVVIGIATVGGEIYGEPIVLLPLGTYWAGDYLGLWWVLRTLNARHSHQ